MGAPTQPQDTARPTARVGVDKHSPHDQALGPGVRPVKSEDGFKMAAPVQGSRADSRQAGDIRAAEQPASTIASRPQGHGSTGTVRPKFHDIRRFCEGNLPFERPVDARPQAVAAHRRECWPHMHEHPHSPGLVQIYNIVKSSSLPNAMSAKIPVPSHMNILAWERYLGALGNRDRVLIL